MKRLALNILTVLLVAGCLAGALYMRILYVSRFRDDATPSGDGVAADLVPRDDLSSLSTPMIDGDGYLHLPDGSTVGDITAAGIKTSQMVVSIPEEWKGQVVASVVRERIRSTGEGVKPYSILRLRFYEQQTWNKYRSQEHYYDDGAADKGLLTEVAATSGSVPALEDDPRWLPLASVRGKGLYRVYLFQQGTASKYRDPEFADSYDRLISCHYANTIASGVLKTDGFVAFAGEFAEQLAESKRALPSWNVTPYPPSDYEPEIEGVLAPPASYAWNYDYHAPWQYPDSGNMYVFGAQESGGAVADHLVPSVVQGNFDGTGAYAPAADPVPAPETQDVYAGDTGEWEEPDQNIDAAVGEAEMILEEAG